MKNTITPNVPNFLAYLRQGNEKIGVMVADIVDDNKLRLGYSVVNVNKGDVFDKELGLHIAYGRTRKKIVVCKEHVKESLEVFAERAKKYFQDKEPDFTILTYTENEERNLNLG